MKKCCINCVFCIRKYNEKLFKRMLGYKPIVLTPQERENALSNNFDFEIKEKEETQSKQVKIGALSAISKKLFKQIRAVRRVLNGGLGKNNHSDDSEPSGVECPYLLCYEGHWDEEKNQTLIKERASHLDDETECAHYCNYEEGADKSFAACRAHREAKKQKKRDGWTKKSIYVGIFAIIVTVTGNIVSNYNTSPKTQKPSVLKTDALYASKLNMQPIVNKMPSYYMFK